jgi:CreA protein
MKRVLYIVLATIIALVVLVILFFWAVSGGANQDRATIGSVSTNFRLLGPNDKVIVERIDDPKIPAISCYVSFAQTGGVKGGLGVAENPSQFGINCIAHGPVVLPADLPSQEEMGAISASFLFKHFIITRMMDAQSKTLVYVLISTKVLSGSPANAVSAVPATAP